MIHSLPASSTPAMAVTVALLVFAVSACSSTPTNLNAPSANETIADDGGTNNSDADDGKAGDQKANRTETGAPDIELTASDEQWTVAVNAGDVGSNATHWAFRWREQGTSWSEWTETTMTPDDAASLRDEITGLQNGVLYDVEVRLRYTDQSLSAVKQATVKPFTTPGRVENLNTQQGNAKLIVSFDEPNDHGGRPVTGYRYRYRNQERGTWTDWQSTATTSLTLTGLANDATYDVEVVAVNNAGSGRKHATTGTPDWSYVDVTPPGDSNRDHFGWDLDASGDHLIVTGDPRDQFQKNDDDPFNHVTFLTRSGDGYHEVKTLQRNGIGTVAAISGDTAAVKMFEVNKQVKHSVRIFRYNNQNWTKETDISVEWGPKLEAYGLHSLDLDASRLAVATSANTKSGKPQGVAEVYERQGDVWVKLGEPVVAPNSDSDGFGTHVAISRSILAVSAPLSDAVHMFRWDGQTWNHTQTINAGNHGTFGSNLDLTQRRLVFGAVASKQVYIYEKNQAGTWEKLATIDAPKGRKKGFGRGVSIDGNLLAVGRRAGNTSGYAFLYEKTGGGWELVGELVNDLVSPKAQVGNSVVLENNRLHVAALSHRNGSGTPRGRVFIFDDVSPRYQAP